MTTTWGGAQWVLATVWVIFTILPPILRAGFGPATEKSWEKFWSQWIVNLIERATLVAILAWGGFWG